ncbi:MAG: phosphate signaling complex protein PhoU [Armatimonadetes bacterium]|nr:phosphate signaling complex protein PhoU [Armatimonadota bacterium]
MTDTVRSSFSEEIRELEQDLLKMGSVVEKMLHKSIEALITRNVFLAEEAIAMDDIVDGYNLAIENRCLKLLALQQPMARDLRTIAGAMKIITDVERMGDYIVDIAKTARELSEEPLSKPLEDIPRMAELVKQMLRDVLEAFVSRDLELIQKMIETDDQVDHLNRSLHEELVGYMQKDPSVVPQAVHLLLITRYLERLADHVTNVGERVYYMETGEMKELHT